MLIDTSETIDSSSNTTLDSLFIDNTLVGQRNTNPLPDRAVIPSRKKIHSQIRQCLNFWYLRDSRKNMFATVYYWSSYRYLTRSNFRAVQAGEKLRSESLITYFYKYRLGWRPTIYHQAKIVKDLPDSLIIDSHPSEPILKRDILYFVQLTLDELFNLSLTS